MHEEYSDQNTALESKLILIRNNFFAQNYNNSYKLCCKNCINDEIQTTTSLGNNISTKYNSSSLFDPSASATLLFHVINFNPDQCWTKAVTIDDYSPLSLFAIRDYSLFAIRYSGFPDTLTVVVSEMWMAQTFTDGCAKESIKTQNKKIYIWMVNIIADQLAVWYFN